MPMGFQEFREDDPVIGKQLAVVAMPGADCV
jgi:hypothetical protein